MLVRSQARNVRSLASSVSLMNGYDRDECQLEGQAVFRVVTSAADVVPTFVMAVPTACRVWVGDPLPILETAVSRSLTADFVASTCGLYTSCAEVETASRFVLTVSSADWIPALPPVRRAGLASAVTDCVRLARAVQTEALPEAVVVVSEALDFELDEQPATATTAIALAATRDLSFTVNGPSVGSDFADMVSRNQRTIITSPG
jgi:hypothetical protein